MEMDDGSKQQSMGSIFYTRVWQLNDWRTTQKLFAASCWLAKRVSPRKSLIKHTQTQAQQTHHTHS